MITPKYPTCHYCAGGACCSLHDAAPEMYKVLELILDFYNMPTDVFVTKHGSGISTKTLGDRVRLVMNVAAEDYPDGIEEEDSQ